MSLVSLSLGFSILKPQKRKDMALLLHGCAALAQFLSLSELAPYCTILQGLYRGDPWGKKDEHRE